jgi:hypothetical protein
VLNTLQRLGGSIGTALLAVVLSDQARAALGPGAAGSGGPIQTLSPAVRAHVATPLATAFGNTFWWALAATLIALIPAGVLAATQRGERQAADAHAAGGGRLSPSRLRARLSLTRSSAPARAAGGMGNAIRTAIQATKAK